jgi:hypothetical protein
MVDGFSTHLFTLDYDRGTKRKGGVIWKYWVDTARDFNVLKYEKRQNGKLVEAVDGVVLQQIRRSGDKPIWYPVKATYRSYAKGPYELSDDAGFSAELKVLKDTLVLNRPVTASMFSVFYRHQAEQSTVLRSLENDFAARAARSSEDGNSFEAVESRLKKEIAEADAVSTRIRGSSHITGFLNFVASQWSSLFFLFGVLVFIGSAAWGIKSKFQQGIS